MEYSRTQKGAPMLILDGYLYIISIKKGSRIRWCYKYKYCKGYVWIENKSLALIRQCSLNSGSNEGYSSSIIAKADILERCKNTNEDFTSVFTSVSSNLDSLQLRDLTSFKSLRSYARRLRNERYMYTPSVYNDIPLALQSTLNGKRFLQFDSIFCLKIDTSFFFQTNSFIIYKKI
ncbi:hypothetical protein DMUE_5324 [Dictyocoela muelleri]|nr:hypothetical protein DMUE_5324 [Dictyocoela muelleri]